jgi:hypothetical protein
MINNQFQKRLDLIKGTEIEKVLATKDIRALMNPSKDFVEGDQEVSPLTF